MDIASNIKKFRELADISRKEMAANLDLSLSAYSKIERGETELTISKLEKISQVLGIDLAQLLSFDTSQIFNISGNQNVQAVAPKAQNMNFYADDYKEKYINVLEQEVARLKEDLKNCTCRLTN
jgi:transcriptional regulator with XRE-family HTH domain